ncbi:MAG: hypothetical protein U1E10_17130 [Bdellovibrionales bacterium]|nr:hypothetical protein [Bdellovibrionales bacterium]
MKLINLKILKTSRGGFDGARALMIIHLVLVLLIPFLFTQMGGCQGQEDTVPLNLGPAISAEEIDKAIGEPLKDATPLSIQLGEGFIYSETQELGVGGAYAVISDTSQTVIERTESATEILMTLIEHKQVYSNGNVQKTSTEIPLRIDKTAALKASNVEPEADATLLMFGPGRELPSLERMVAEATPTTSVNSSGAKLRPEIQSLFRERSPHALLSALRARILKAQSTNGEAVSTMADTVTYHGLKTSMTIEAPPELVQKRENCAGLPDCKLRVYNIEFDMVFWDKGKPDRVHWNLAMSPDAPYLAGLLNKCVTGLAPLGGNQGEILVKQCMPVVDFRFTN